MLGVQELTRNSSSFFRNAYFVSGVSVSIAAVISVALTSYFGGRAPLAPFTLAVLLSAWYGGWWPGLLATGASIAIVRLLFVQAVFSFIPVEAGPMLLASFAVLGVAISAVAEKLLSANAKLAKAKARLEQTNEALNAEVRERIRVAEELQQQTTALTRSNEDLQRFAFVISHDLQEPLRTIENFADLLVRRNKGRLHPDSEEFAKFILDGVAQARQFVQDVLTIATMAPMGREPELFESADCMALLQTALNQLQARIESSQARITYDALPTIRANATQIVQLFVNLIGNAIKYCDGRPQVHISAQRDGGCWIISVRDNGIGIASEHQAQVFRLFKRLHSQREYPGTGVGLAICKRVVECHGGTIRVESAGPGKGSTFYFTVPGGLGTV